jgi:hypothetical protein
VRSDGSVVSWSRSQLQIAFLPSKSDNPQAQHWPSDYPIPCFHQPFDCRYPKRGSVSKSFENVKFRMHSGPQAE